MESCDLSREDTVPSDQLESLKLEDNVLSTNGIDNVSCTSNDASNSLNFSVDAQIDGTDGKVIIDATVEIEKLPNIDDENDAGGYGKV